MPLICESLEKGEFHVLEKDQYDMGKSKKRHGSVIPISEKEMEALIDTYGTEEA